MEGSVTVPYTAVNGISMYSANDIGTDMSMSGETTGQMASVSWNTYGISGSGWPSDLSGPQEGESVEDVNSRVYSYTTGKLYGGWDAYYAEYQNCITIHTGSY